MALQAGDLVPLSRAQLDRVTLEGVDGRPLGLGRLGQNRGMRALRLAEAEDLRPRLPMAGLPQLATGTG